MRSPELKFTEFLRAKLLRAGLAVASRNGFSIS
jgi:hypothetical protein